MYLIAEIGSNWDGDIELAKDTIDACYHAGADAVKFQLWDADIIYGKDADKYRKWEMNVDQFEKLYKYCKFYNITCFATPSYPEAVDFLESLHVPLYKIASVTSAQMHPLAKETMQKVADTGKPVIISYGYGNKTEKIFNENYLIEMECIPEYPAKMSDYGYNYPNLSDHTKSTSLMLEWINRNNHAYIEKHVKLRDNSSPDSPFSLYTSELADFITLSKSSLFKLG